MSTDYVSLLKSLGLQPQQQSHREHFLVQNNDGYTVLNVQDINHISTENGITRAFLHNGRSMVLNYSLNDIEAQFNPSKFFRANVRAAQRMNRQVIKQICLSHTLLLVTQLGKCKKINIYRKNI